MNFKTEISLVVKPVLLFCLPNSTQIAALHKLIVMFVLLAGYQVIDFLYCAAFLYNVAEELWNSELEKSSQATRIQTLEGICCAL